MKRRQAREIAVQSLYLMEMNEVKAEQAVHTMIHEVKDDEEPIREYRAEDLQFVIGLVQGVSERSSAIDELVSGYLQGWKVERLSRVDKQILRLAVYELFYLEDTPHKVAINEAIELAKHFGTEESGKFVNGVLGKMVRETEQIKLQVNASL